MGKLIDALLAQCGLRPDRVSWIWLAGAGICIGLSTWIREIGDPMVSIAFTVCTMLAYYVGNTLYLTRWSAGARGLEGERAERAWRDYQVVLGLMFLANGLGFTVACDADLPGARLPIDATTATIAGVSISAVGIAVKTWATMIVGVDCYFYRDLFFRRRVWGFTRRGPYALFANPMYGVGNLQAYGLAIFTRSATGLAAAILCHMAIYTFHFVVERPFVQETLATPHPRGAEPAV